MLPPGPALKITIHLNADISARQDFLHEEILRFLFERGVAGATMLWIQTGFGSHHHLHTAGAPGREGSHLPVRIEFIETSARVEALLPKLLEMVTDGLIEAHPTTILKFAQNASPLEREGEENRS